MKKGFTLAELMVAMVVLGILTAAVVPAIISNMPNNKKIMIKRAYYITTNTVKDMLNNENLYPTISDKGGYCAGFNNPDTVTYKGTTYSAQYKFAEIFISFLKTKGDIDTSTSNCSYANSSSACRTVYTSDGVRWSFSIPTYSSTVNSDGVTIIDEDQHVSVVLVDINGDKKPNCYEGSSSCKNLTKNFDQFIMEIWMDGTVQLQANQSWVQETINATSSITDTD